MFYDSKTLLLIETSFRNAQPERAEFWDAKTGLQHLNSVQIISENVRSVQITVEYKRSMQGKMNISQNPKPPSPGFSRGPLPRRGLRSCVPPGVPVHGLRSVLSALATDRNSLQRNDRLPCALSKVRLPCLENSQCFDFSQSSLVASKPRFLFQKFCIFKRTLPVCRTTGE